MAVVSKGWKWVIFEIPTASSKLSSIHVSSEIRTNNINYDEREQAELRSYTIIWRRKVRFRSISIPSSLWARTTIIHGFYGIRTLVILLDQDIWTMISKIVSQILRNQITELLFHCVHKSLGEGDLGTSSHSLQFLHVFGELTLLDLMNQIDEYMSSNNVGNGQFSFHSIRPWNQDILKHLIKAVSLLNYVTSLFSILRLLTYRRSTWYPAS